MSAKTNTEIIITQTIKTGNLIGESEGDEVGQATEFCRLLKQEYRNLAESYEKFDQIRINVEMESFIYSGSMLDDPTVVTCGVECNEVDILEDLRKCRDDLQSNDIWR